jgi:cytidine deaminase
MPSWQLSAEERGRLLTAARGAVSQAYAPYSKIRVGAALLTEKGNLFSGANVENASYGLSLCAERAAIAAAVAGEGAAMRLKGLAVLNETGTAFAPCGACRQVILEFGPEAVILFQGQEGLQEQKAKDLLPEGFRLV